MGHASVSITAHVYLHAIKKPLGESAMKLERYLTGNCTKLLRICYVMRDFKKSPRRTLIKGIDNSAISWWKGRDLFPLFPLP